MSNSIKKVRWIVFGLTIAAGLAVGGVLSPAPAAVSNCADEVTPQGWQCVNPCYTGSPCCDACDF